MSKYRIDPAGVSTTLKASAKDGEAIETALTPLEGDVNAVATACGGSGAIVPALETLFTYEGKHLTAMAQQIKACLTGAALATTAYVHGDEQMVQNAQSNAAAAKTSTIPKKWLPQH